jgi:hypothetical protein
MIGLALLGCICFLSWLSASAESEPLTGAALTAAGLLMLWQPVRQRMPTGCGIAAGLWLLGSLLAFLPENVSAWPAWRGALAVAGVDSGRLFTPQPMAALGSLAVMAATGLVALWAACQGSGSSKRLGIGFVAAVVAYALLAWLAPSLLNFQSNAQGTFGFFPNRNHSATLLVMGCMVSLGLLVQGVRWRSPWQIGAASLALIFLLGVLFSLSISRAGILLLVAGAALWSVLAGPRYLRGHVGKAVALILGGSVLIFSLLDTPVRQRVEVVLGKVAAAPAGAPTAPLMARLEKLDSRVDIHRDTAAMISDAPLGGWGAGQFQFVFPQYQDHTTNLSGKLCLHPESDWLWLTAECGVPATLALIWLAAALIIPALRSIRKGTARASRAGLLVAAMMLPLHGLLDVPGHQFSLLWTAAALLGLAGGVRDPAKYPRAAAIAWRVGGLAVAMLGASIIHGSATDRPLLPSDRSNTLFAEAQEIYLEDHRAALTAETVAAEQGADPLEHGLEKLNLAAEWSPLDPRVAGLKGMLALHFDDMDDLARQSFAIQRALEPLQISLPLAQADAWSRINVTETRDLWLETMRRAKRMEEKFPGTPWETNTFERILQRARSSGGLLSAAVEAAGSDPVRLQKAARVQLSKDAKDAQ